MPGVSFQAASRTEPKKAGGKGGTQECPGRPGAEGPRVLELVVEGDAFLGGTAGTECAFVSDAPRTNLLFSNLFLEVILTKPWTFSETWSRGGLRAPRAVFQYQSEKGVALD